MKSGDKIKTMAGTTVSVPFKGEHPCFGQRQGWCTSMATWEVAGSHLVLHFCDACKARGIFKDPKYKWAALVPHPTERSLRE